MGKQPYIPLYIGDWETDTNCLSPLAEFALLKLTFKLFNSEKRGVFEANFKTLSILFKSDLETTKVIFNELIENKVLNIGLISDDKFQIISRRMTREANISEIRSQVGKKGGSKTQAKLKQNKKKGVAKSKQNPDIDIKDGIDIETKNNEDVFVDIFTSNIDLKNALNGYIEMRTEIKSSLSKNQIELAKKKVLNKAKGNYEDAVEMLNNSALNKWKGFYLTEKEAIGKGEMAINSGNNYMNQRYGNGNN